MRLIVVCAALMLAAPALAQEQHGCDAFKWPLDAEKAALASAEKLAPSAETALDRSAAGNSP